MQNIDMRVAKLEQQLTVTQIQLDHVREQLEEKRMIWAIFWSMLVNAGLAGIGGWAALSLIHQHIL